MEAVTTDSVRAPLDDNGAQSSARRPWAALRRLLRGCQHAALYPQDHPGFESALQLAQEGCRELLTVFPTCTLHLDPLGLYLMGEPCPPDASFDRFAALLRARDLPALTFLQGAGKEEVLGLLELLAAEPEDIAAQGGAAALLTRAGARHLTLASQPIVASYHAALQSALSGLGMLDRAALERLLALCPEACRVPLEEGAGGAGMNALLVWVAEALGATAATMPPGAPNHGEWLQQVLRAVRGLSPELKGRLYRAHVGAVQDVLGEVAALLTPAEVAEALVCYPNAVAGEPSDQLGAVLTRLLPDEARVAEVEPLAKVRLLSQGMTEESYQSIVSLLLRRSRPETAPPVEAAPRARMQRVSRLTDLLASTSSWSLQETQVDMLLELAVAPGEVSGRASALRRLVELLPGALAERRDERAAELLRRLDEAIALDTLSAEERRTLRGALTEACTPDLCRRLARVLIREPSPENASLLWLLSRAQGGFTALLLVAKETLLPWLQAATGAAIARMGEASALACRELLTTGPIDEATALARALVLSDVREGLDRALWAWEHPDRHVAEGLLDALAYSHDEKAHQVLIEALRSGAPELQCAAARGLALHPSAPAVEALGELLGSPAAARRPEVARAALTALGQMQRSEALPILQAVLARRPGVLRGPARELWALAVQALAALPDPAAEALLRAHAARGPAELTALCTEALAGRPTAARREGGRD